MDNKINKSKTWIGLATLTPKEGNNDLGEAEGAVVNVLDKALEESDFILKIQNKVSQFGYNLVEIEDVEVFDFTKRYGDNLAELAKEVQSNGKFQWGTFYAFDEEE